MGLSFTDRALGLVLGAAAIFGFIFVVTKFIDQNAQVSLLTPPQPPTFLSPPTLTPAPVHTPTAVPPPAPPVSPQVPSTTATVSELPLPVTQPNQGVTGNLTLSVSPAQSQRAFVF